MSEEFLSDVWLARTFGPPAPSPASSAFAGGAPAVQIMRPNYDRSKTRAGVVHFGPGAFHRAHQAQALDDILAHDPRWAITGVSLHSPDVRNALAPQDGLFTLALLDTETSFRVIGSIKDVLVAPENPEAVFARLTAPETEIVTLTITEKGYCLTPDGQWDGNHPDIRADLENPAQPKSAVGYLVEGLRRRKAAGLKPFAVISCDNLSGNGDKLAASVWTLARAQSRDTDPARWDFSKWITDEGAFPCTMVDSITPATNDALRDRVAGVLGVRDRWPIQREAFTQWVMQRELRGRMPDIDWEAGGVTLTHDVAAYERAKLRILNASHSALAYLGLARGHETVADAIGDPELAAFVRAFMTEDVAPWLNAPFDAKAYVEAVLARFRNPAIRHLLSQIAWDGSQKLPNRLFPLIEEGLRGLRPIDRPARIAAAWLIFLRRKAQSGGGDKLVDPLAPLLLEVAARCTGEPDHDVGLFLALDAVFPRPLGGMETFRRALASGYAELLKQA